MGIRQRMTELKSVEDVDNFLNLYPTSVIFKAGTCHKTMQGFGYVEQVLNNYDNLHLAFVKVVEYRPASNYIAEITKVIHQSPQFILFVNKQAVFDIDNWDITISALEKGLNKHLPNPTSLSDAHLVFEDKTSISPYVTLLQSYVQDEMSEDVFTQRWLLTFQSDATLRSTEEFNLLNNLFGDVDAFIQEKGFKEDKTSADPENSLKVRSKKLLEILTASA
ncbi:MAG: hypothetical protein BGO10_06815 [Chlamydia sp. 32-24]|nr:MAG: hypothetical protein BGO10_06815 [Chlamydia sp. 32-24]